MPREGAPLARIDTGILLAARVEAGLSQREPAPLAGTSGVTVAVYERGTKEPRLFTLQRLLGAVGMRLELSYVPASSSANGDLTREDRRSLALHRFIAARLAGDPRAVSRKAVRNLKVMRRGDDGSAAPWLEEWDRLLRGPVSAVIEVLVSHDQRARDLRQVTPFVGVLSDEERRAIYRTVAVAWPARRDQLEHLIRVSGHVLETDEVIVIGSQAILASVPAGLPQEAIRSIEADILPIDDPDETKADLIDGLLGEASAFQETHGIDAQGVGQHTARLPYGWRDRLIPLCNQNTDDITGWWLERHDLCVSKLLAGRPKDIPVLPCADRHWHRGAGDVARTPRAIDATSADQERMQAFVRGAARPPGQRA